MSTQSKAYQVIMLGLLLSLPACSSFRHHGGGTATVEFVQPEKYSDIELRGSPPEKTREQVLPDLERYVKKQAALHIPAGQKLDLRITDINDAGWILPIRPPPRRIVRDVQPARIDFEYTLTDSSGTVLTSGRETLSDMHGDRLDRSFDNEQMPLVKEMLSRWIDQIGRHSSKPGIATGSAQ
jgi:hypothetical protein